MNPQDQAVLDEILQKEEAALSESEVAILRARESYVSSDDKARYPGVFKTAGAEGEPTRKELEAKASELGIKKVSDKKRFPNKEALTKAIEEKTAGAEGEE